MAGFNDMIGQIEPIVLFGLIAVAGVILFVVLSVGLYVFFNRMQKEAIKQIAKRDNELTEGLGLAYEPRERVFSGSYLGRKVRLSNSHGRSGPPSTSIEAELSNPPSGSMEVRYVGYEVRREGVYEWAKRFLEARYFPKLEVGDPDFDEVFRIKGTPENFVLSVLGSAHLRERLLDLDTDSPFIGVMENKLILRVINSDDGVDYFSQLLEFVCEFAESVENTGT